MMTDHSILSRIASGNYKRAALAALLFVAFCDGSLSQNQDAQPRVPKKEYSAQKPAEWERYAEDHPPRIEISMLSRTENVRAFIYLKDYSETHYIESMGILDPQGKIVASQSFSRGQGKSFNARFSLNSMEEGYKVYAKCSQHDLWVTPIEEARFIDGKSPF